MKNAFIKHNPRLGVVISTHNRPEKLKSLLSNILNQTLSEIIVVVADNGTNSRTLKVSQEVRDGDDRVLSLNSSRHGKGPTFNRNFGIANIPPIVPYTFVIDDDDKLEDNRSLEKLVRTMDKCPDAPMGYCIQNIGENGINRASYSRLTAVDQVVDHKPQFPAKTMIFRTSFLREAGGYSPQYKDSAEDFGLAVDTLLWAKNNGLPIGFTEDASVYFDASRDPNKTTVLNIMNRRAIYAQSRNIVRAKFLKLFGFKS